MIPQSPKELEFWQRYQWKANKRRLRLFVCNLFTFGLGENLWYGDRLDRKANSVTPVRVVGRHNVDGNHEVAAPEATKKLADTGNEIESGALVERGVIGRYQITIELLHQSQLARNEAKAE